MIGLSAGISDDRIVPADEVLAAIKAGGPVDFDSCTIAGDLDLSTLKIVGTVHFNHTIFQDSVNLSYTTLNNAAYFRRAVFSRSSDFEHAVFDGDAYFRLAAFNSYADFGGVVFNGSAEFWGTVFTDSANFNDVVFSGDADFWEAVFTDDVDFNDAVFNSDADFDRAVFNPRADFWGAVFNSGAYFKEVVFNNDADFEKVGFKGAGFNITDFTAAQFNKEANFEDASFAGKAIFDKIRFKEDALFENSTFHDELSLIRARYSKLFIRWSSIQGGLAYDDAAYMSLMKNFKDLGYFEDYDSCYYAYRKAHRSEDDWPAVPDWEEAIRKAIDRPMEWFYGYGTKPFNAFFWSLGIILAFSLFWWALGLGGPRDKTRESLKDGAEWLDGDLFDLLSFSATVFLSGTRLLIDPPALPMIEGRSRSLIKKAFVLERVLGALFSVMFFIAISGTIVRAS